MFQRFRVLLGLVVAAHAGACGTGFLPDESSYGGQKASPLESGNWDQGLRRIQAIEAWEQYGLGATDVPVAILDLSFSSFEPELAGQIDLVRGYDSQDEDNSPGFALHPFGKSRHHGTAMAGVIAARPGSYPDTAGLMWRSSLILVRGKNLHTVAEEIRWILEQRPMPRVISVSLLYWLDDEMLAGDKTNPATDFLAAVSEANDAGVLIVAGVENSGVDYGDVYAVTDDSFPAGDVPFPAPALFGFPNVIAVTAVDESDRVLGTAFGAPFIDIAAPGTGSYLQAGGKTRETAGPSASMATAYVAGTVGLMLSLDPTASPEAIVSALRLSSENVGNLDVGGPNAKVNWGRLNVLGALQALEQQGFGKQPRPPVAAIAHNAGGLISLDAPTIELAAFVSDANDDPLQTQWTVTQPDGSLLRTSSFASDERALSFVASRCGVYRVRLEAREKHRPTAPTGKDEVELPIVFGPFDDLDIPFQVTGRKAEDAMDLVYSSPGGASLTRFRFSDFDLCHADLLLTDAAGKVLQLISGDCDRQQALYSAPLAATTVQVHVVRHASNESAPTDPYYAIPSGGFRIRGTQSCTSAAP